MKTPIIRVVLFSIVAGLLVATAGMASAGRLGFSRVAALEKAADHRDSSAPEGDPTTCPSEEEPSEEDGASERQPTVKECEPAEPADDGTSKPEDTEDGIIRPEVTEDTGAREGECKAAGGLSTVRAGEDGSEATADDGTERGTKAKGLSHAIEVVLANCIKNPQAPGLLNALRHLVENRDRQMAREAEKALRRTAREAAKAARRSAKAHGKSSR